MNKQKFHNVMKWIIFVIYMCLLIYVVFFAESMGRTSQTRHIYNLEPFKEIKRFWKYILDNDSLGRIARLNIMEMLLRLFLLEYFFQCYLTEIKLIATTLYSFKSFFGNRAYSL
ncbi:MAG: VanZ family protein [Lachnospira pectinoschiza]